MSVLPIVKWPDPLLKEVSQPVEKIDEEIQKFMDNMYDTMIDAHGIGLAAVQVGVLKRILIIEIQPNERYEDVEKISQKEVKPLFIVNPKITKKSEEIITYKEGCLSFPNQFADVKRNAELTLEYQDYNGQNQTLEADGLLAICIQHEIDHLNGVRFIDHLSKLKRDIILKKLKKYKKNENN